MYHISFLSENTIIPNHALKVPQETSYEADIFPWEHALRYFCTSYRSFHQLHICTVHWLL